MVPPRIAVLERYGFVVRTVTADAVSGDRLGGFIPFDLVLAYAARHRSARWLDWITDLHQRFHWIPIVVAIPTDEPDALQALQGVNADDFFVPSRHGYATVVTRLRQALHRAHATVEHALWEGVTHNLVSQTLRTSALVVPLSSRESQLLHFLWRHKNVAIPHRVITQYAWDMAPDRLQPKNVLAFHVCGLRRKLLRLARGRLLHAVRGEGYMLSG
jgi:DNA-binding response OmpR family regulator